MEGLISCIGSYFKHPPNTVDTKIIDLEDYHTTTLPGLIPELLLKIFDFLPPADSVCLSLCNHRLFDLAKVHYRRGNPIFSLEGAERLSVLVRLEKHIPEYFACNVCNKLHRYDGSESLGLSDLFEHKTSKLPCDYRSVVRRRGGILPKQYPSVATLRTHKLYDFIRCRLSFHQLKLAMRRFYYGASAGINIESLSFTQVNLSMHPWKPEVSLLYPLSYEDWISNRRPSFGEVPQLFSIEAQIYPKPLGLYIRMQDIILYERRYDIGIQLTINPIRDYEICYHNPLSSRLDDLDKLKDGREALFNYACPQCDTVCEIEIKDFDSRVAIIMTRWINLGPGLDHEDPLWKIHTNGCPEDRRQKIDKSQKSESPRICFEEVASESFEELQARNLSYLEGNRFQKGKPFRIDDTHRKKPFWYIAYKDPSRRWGIMDLWDWLYN